VILTSRNDHLVCEINGIISMLAAKYLNIAASAERSKARQIMKHFITHSLFVITTDFLLKKYRHNDQTIVTPEKIH